MLVKSEKNDDAYCDENKCISDLCAKCVTVSDTKCNQLKYPEICGEYKEFHIDRQLGKPIYKNLNYSGIILRPTHHFWIFENNAFLNFREKNVKFPRYIRKQCTKFSKKV